jgi:hypothetical protein
MWMFATIAVPVAAWALGKAGQELERRRGSSRTSRLLRSTSERFSRRSQR